MKRRLVSLLCCFCCVACTMAAARGDDLWGRVGKVIDGDTVMLSSGTMVRYIGIDAPEIDHKHNKADPLGFAALSANKEWVSNCKIRLVSGHESIDRHGRLLAYVYDEQGRHINQELLEQGLAHVLYTKQNNRYWSSFLSAQRRAMRRNIGIWRHIDKSTGPVVANTSSKRFHTTTCRFGKRIRKNNMTAYKRKWDAYWHGYAPCRQCFPPSTKQTYPKSLTKPSKQGER